MLQLVEVELPARVRVPMPRESYLFIDQQIWVLEGRLRFIEGEEAHELVAGDCLNLESPNPASSRTRQTRPAVTSSRYASGNRDLARVGAGPSDRHGSRLVVGCAAWYLAVRPSCWRSCDVGRFEYCVLALLRDGDRYGFELTRELADADGLVTSEGTVYPLLARLRQEGLVETTWQESSQGPPRRYYRLTEEGHKALAAFTTQWRRFRDATTQSWTRRAQMEDPVADAILNQYFRRLEQALSGLPAERRSQIVEDLRTHVQECLQAESDHSDATILAILDRVGDPDEIAAEALADEALPDARGAAATTDSAAMRLSPRAFSREVATDGSGAGAPDCGGCRGSQSELRPGAGIPDQGVRADGARTSGSGSYRSPGFCEGWLVACFGCQWGS